MQAAEMQRQREQDMLRQQLQQAQIGKYQFDMDTSRATAEAAQGEQQRLAQLGQWIQTNKPELFPAFQLDPKSVAAQLLPQKPERMTLRPGEVLYEDGKFDTPLVSVPGNPPTPTEIERLIAAQKQFPQGSSEHRLLGERIAALNYRQPPSNMNVSYGAPFVGVGPDGKEMLFQSSNRGGPPAPLGLAPPAKAPPPVTESNSNSFLFANRAQTANQIIQSLGDKPSVAGASLQAGLGGVPLIGSSLEAGANFALSGDTQKYVQAKRDFINAVLRKESGAVIGASEFESADKQYFPQPGDGPAVIQQKAQNRQRAISGLSTGAGPLAPRVGESDANNDPLGLRK
jgi:hypothetical protein